MDSKVDFAAGGIVLIDNKVLLVKNRLRKEYKEYYDSGFWGFPKGHMEERDRVYSNCASRELYEETGVRYNILQDKFCFTCKIKLFKFPFFIDRYETL